MVKYRLLTIEELGALEQDFVKFLILNGISAEDWVKLKSEDESNALKMISLFSDVVFEGIVRKADFMEFIDADGLKLFKCAEEEITLISLQRIDQRPFDYGDKLLLLAALKENPSDFGTYTASKAYKPTRNAEVYRMIESGGQISDKAWFELFENIIH